MYLDDELLEMCRAKDCSKPENIKQLSDELYQKCQNYYIQKITLSTPCSEAKVLITRAFNLWDSFVRRAIKEGGKMALLGEFFQEYSLKKILLSNERFAEMYKKL